MRITRGIVIRFSIAFATGVGFWLRLGPRAGALWFVFLLWLLFEWDDRALAATALLCLATCPILLAIKQDAWSELMAQYAFFFLTMVVTLRIQDLVRHPKPEETIEVSEI